MIYLGNGIYSSAGDVLIHGGPWKKHKYIRIENGRYIYPLDIAGMPPPKIGAPGKVKKYASTRNQGPSDPEWAQRTGSGSGTSRNVYNYEETKPKNKLKKKLSKAYDKTGDVINKILDKDTYADLYDKTINKAVQKHKYKDLYGTVKVTSPSAAERAQRGSNGQSRNTQNMPSYGRPSNSKYSKSVSSQGPSAAERAQTNRSVRTGTARSRNVQNMPKTATKSTGQGPSAAERAQTNRSVRTGTARSRNVQNMPKYSRLPKGRWGKNSVSSSKLKQWKKNSVSGKRRNISYDRWNENSTSSPKTEKWEKNAVSKKRRKLTLAEKAALRKGSWKKWSATGN